MKQVEDEQTSQLYLGAADFKMLYHRHYCDVFNQVEKRIKNEEISADITQQVFLEAIRSLKKYNYQQYGLSTHLYRTIINKCSNFFRSGRHKRHLVVNEKMTTTLLEEVGLMSCHGAKKERLIQALELLNIQEIELLELRFAEHKIFHEQGYIMNMSENTAKLKTYSLLNKIKCLMKSDFGGLNRMKKVEIIESNDPRSKEQLKSYMHFDSLWEEFNSSKATMLQLMRDALSYLEGNVLKRAFAGLICILFLGVFADDYLVEKQAMEIKAQPAPPNPALNIDGAIQVDMVYSTNMVCLSV
jgi:RNA polymerase sigma-70 factor (ECF subfamily)